LYQYFAIQTRQNGKRFVNVFFFFSKRWSYFYWIIRIFYFSDNMFTLPAHIIMISRIYYNLDPPELMWISYYALRSEHRVSIYTHVFSLPVDAPPSSIRQRLADGNSNNNAQTGLVYDITRRHVCCHCALRLGFAVVVCERSAPYYTMYVLYRFRPSTLRIGTHWNESTTEYNTFRVYNI